MAFASGSFRVRLGSRERVSKGAFRAVALVQPGPAARKWVLPPATLRTARAASRGRWSARDNRSAAEIACHFLIPKRRQTMRSTGRIPTERRQRGSQRRFTRAMVCMRPMALQRFVGIHRVQGTGGKCSNSIQKMAAHVAAIVSGGFPLELKQTQCAASAVAIRHTGPQKRDTPRLP